MKNGFIYINDNIFETLIALSEEEQNKGLMYIPFPTPIMCFAYNKPKINKFWMKNTPSPLDIVFCCNDKINQICYGEPYSLKLIGSDLLSDLVIELPYGTIEKLRIKNGFDVGFIKPTKFELFKI